MLLRVHELTHLILLNFLQALLCHINITFVRLSRFSQIKALLSRLFILKHLVLHHGLHDVVFFIVIVDNALHVAAICFSSWRGSVRVLF